MPFAKILRLISEPGSASALPVVKKSEIHSPGRKLAEFRERGIGPISLCQPAADDGIDELRSAKRKPVEHIRADDPRFTAGRRQNGLGVLCRQYGIPRQYDLLFDR